MAQPFTIGEILHIGWTGFRANVGVALGIAVTFLVLHAVGLTIPFINVIYAVAVQFPLQAGMALVGVKLADAGHGRHVGLKVADLFAGFSRYGTTLGAGWLVALIFVVPALVAALILVAVGLSVDAETDEAVWPIFFIAVLLFTPLVYLGLRLMFVFPLVMDQNIGAVDAIKASWQTTNGHVLRLFVLGLLAGGVVLLGLVMLLVGVLPAMMVTSAMFGAAYRKVVAPAGPGSDGAATPF